MQKVRATHFFFFKYLQILYFYRFVFTALEQWPLRDDWYSSDLVEKIFALSSNLQNLPEDYVKSAILVSVVFTYIVATHTDFFGYQLDRERLNDLEILKLMAQNEEFGVFAGLLTRLVFIATFNSYRVCNQQIQQ